ncbi:MAG: acyl-CoA dehydrogenase family protein [Hyphomicrobiaceae bacterium]
MDFALSSEQELLIATAAKVGERFGLDYWKLKDQAKAYPAECWQAICEAGLSGTAIPEAYGGAGLGMLELALAIEELCAAGAGGTLAQLFMLNPIFGGMGLLRAGSETQKRDMLPKLVSGKLTFAMALTEPDAGTNSLAIRTFARRDGNGWRISGRKIWITGVDKADKLLIVARTTRIEDSPRKTHGITLFLLDRTREGIAYDPIAKLGTNTLTSSNVFLDDVRAEADEQIGTIDGGWAELLDVLNTERIVTTAGLVGTGRLAMRLAVDYAAQRKVFGDRPIGAYQGLQFPMAQAHAELSAARLKNLEAAWRCDQGKPYGSEANAAKLIAAQAATSAIERAMQVMGGMGYAVDSHLERLWRDNRLFKFAPVSEEMILNYIAQQDLGLPRSY